ncbi:MAG: enoyl-CoA hydratase/isomerase family protein [Alphaproteobacteria bacterium]|nr:enoyl-CoA hydratase/isomerase family protein [Alphaproteobacteria bacterium]
MEFYDIRFERPEPMIAEIVLNRPKAMNAYTSRLCRELMAAIDSYVADDALRCLIITGEGRGFCAGGDIGGGDGEHAAYMQRQLGHAQEMRENMHSVIAKLHRIDKPVIAMINGAAVAGGLTLALACDLRIAADNARLGDTSGRFALLPDEGGAWFFPRAMGLDRALKMTLLSETYSATEAERLGLVTEVVPAGSLRAHTLDLARRVAAKAPLAVRLAKAMMRHGLDSTLERALNDAAFAVMIANPTTDVREGVRAFAEKREPSFQGK